MKNNLQIFHQVFTTVFCMFGTHVEVRGRLLGVEIKHSSHHSSGLALAHYLLS